MVYDRRKADVVSEYKTGGLKEVLLLHLSDCRRFGRRL